ncbi:MAG: hypothetical protein IKE56_07870 [Lachnospiraceae bacterium]|nr:hypothetical protein [Lachnospiraceae bacterium]
MAQNITLMGASYSAVPAVTLPKTGGGTARFDDASVTTATAADVASGKIFLASDGTITTGTNSGGGGGASNVVTGTFKGTTTGAAMDVTLNYTGSGYPIALVICPTEGPYNSETGTFYSLVQRYVTAAYFMVKSRIGTSPVYSSSSDNDDYATVTNLYKNSASVATTYATAQTSTRWFRNTNAGTGGSGGTLVCRFKSNTKMSVYIASTSYGFAANIEYTYRVLYSS